MTPNIGFVEVKIDSGRFSREISRVLRDAARDEPAESKGSKLIIGKPFIDALVENGIVPKGTTYVRITAEIDTPIRCDYETYGTADLVAVAEAMAEAETHEEAKAR